MSWLSLSRTPGPACCLVHGQVPVLWVGGRAAACGVGNSLFHLTSWQHLSGPLPVSWLFPGPSKDTSCRFQLRSSLPLSPSLPRDQCTLRLWPHASPTLSPEPQTSLHPRFQLPTWLRHGHLKVHLPKPASEGHGSGGTWRPSHCPPLSSLSPTLHLCKSCHLHPQNAS